jgi:DNA modification methylase
MQLIETKNITILQNRQRKEFEPNALIELAGSIAANGLIQPIVVRGDSEGIKLVAGERRLRAIQALWEMGDSYSYGGSEVPQGQIPCNFIKDLDPLDAMEIELEENIRRTDLSWQDRCTATAQLGELRRLQARRANQPPPSTASVAAELYPEHHPNAAHEAVRKEVILAANLHDPDVAAAKSMDEGIKVIRRKEEASRAAALGVSVGKTFGQHSHRLFLGNCLDILKTEPDSQFDVILTDPPYGIDAQDFNDSGGKANAAGHVYDDSLATWTNLMGHFAPESFRLAKPQAHLYCFCDVDNFLTLRDLMARAGWECFRTPLVWHNPTSQRAPWPQHGPHRRYQLCLYAIKGKRNVIKLSPDVVTYASDQNLGWAAQKPVDLYRDFLSRSCRPGDFVLDPFCGSGTIFPAAHGLKIRAMGVEVDKVAYGIAVKRIAELK